MFQDYLFGGHKAVNFQNICLLDRLPKRKSFDPKWASRIPPIAMRAIACRAFSSTSMFSTSQISANFPQSKVQESNGIQISDTSIQLWVTLCATRW